MLFSNNIKKHLMKYSFFNRNGKGRYQYLVLNDSYTDGGYFVKEYFNSKTNFTESEIIEMLNF